MVQLERHEGGDGNGEEDCRGLKDRRVVGKERGRWKRLHRGRIVTRLSGGFVGIAVYTRRYFVLGFR